MDAKYIKGMINEPDLQPNATINRWIQGILLFDFELVHVPAEQFKGPDGLSRRTPTQDEREEDENDDSWLDDIVLFYSQPMDQDHQIFTTHYKNPSLSCLMTQPSDQQKKLSDIEHFLTTLELPEFQSNQQKKRFINKALQFFMQDGLLFKRNKHGTPLRVIMDTERRQEILSQAHEELGHKGEHSVFHMIRRRFYWPNMWSDVRHHVKSCHQCQIRSTQKVELPLLVSTPATLFVKIYVDVMLMPQAHGFRYIVAARDDLSRKAEGRALKKANAKSMAKFFWEQIICRYGYVGQVVTDNGPEVKGAFESLMQRYGIPHVHISAYNSKANGVVERGHFDIREAIVKACKGDISKWPDHVHAAFFADSITTGRSRGFSPYYLLHGIDPVLPFDLTEATFLVQGFHSDMETSDLLALRIQQLEKHPEDIALAAKRLAATRFKSKEQFEKRYVRRLTKNVYQPGDLVLVRNSKVEKELDRKTKPRYNGPFRVIRRTNKGSYVLEELDGTVSRRGIAGFRLLPYITRNSDIQELLGDPDELSDDELDETL